MGEAILTVGATGKSMAGSMVTLADGEKVAVSGTTNLNTALGILANVGIKGSEGGTHLRNVILSLQSPTDDAADALKELGVEVYDSQGKMRPLNDILTDLNAGMEGCTDSTKDMYKSLIFNKTDLASVNALLDASGESWNKLSAEIEDSKDAMKDMADTQLDNLQGDLTILSSGVDGLKMAFYNTFSDQLRTGVQGATSLISRLTEGIGNLNEAAKVGGFSSFVNQLKTYAQEAMLAVGEKLGQIVPLIMEKLPEAVTGMTSFAVGMIQSLTTGISANLPTVLQTFLEWLVGFSGTIRENAGNLIDAGLAMIQSIANGIIANIPTLIETIPTIVTNIAGIINDNAPKLLATGLSIIVSLAKGLIQAIPTLIANIPQIIQAIVAVFTAFNWMNLGKNIIQAFKNGITAMKSAVTTAGSNIKEAVISAIKELPSKLMSMGKSGMSGLKSAFTGAVSGISSAAAYILTAIINALKAMPTKLLSLAKSAISKVVSAFKNTSWSSVGSNIVKGIVSGLSAGLSSIVSKAKELAKSALNAAKSALGIHSPSRVFRDEVGEMISIGMAEGIEDKAKIAVDSVKNMSNSLIKQVGEVEFPSIISASNTSTSNGINFGDIVNRLTSIHELLRLYVPDLASRQIVMNTGAVVGQLARPMDEALKELLDKKGRGR